MGEQVVVFSPSGQTVQGVVICGLFSALIPANGDRAGLHRRTYPDGAVVEYDSEAHRLRAILPAGGVTDLTSPGGINIVGPVCESGDFLAKDRSLPAAKAGDLLVVASAGAYGAVQSGTYNTRALVPEVLVKDDAYAVVRPRMEVEDLIALDRLPPWL